MDPVPDHCYSKSGSAGDRTRDLCICSQKLWPLDYRGGPTCHLTTGNQKSLQSVTLLQLTTQSSVRHAVAQLVEALCNKPEDRVFDSRWCHCNFSLTQSFWPQCGPGVYSACNRNEYKEYFLGGKSCRCVRLTSLPPSCADCLEIWETQPTGVFRHVQACNGIALLSRMLSQLSHYSDSNFMLFNSRHNDNKLCYQERLDRPWRPLNFMSKEWLSREADLWPISFSIRLHSIGTPSGFNKTLSGHKPQQVVERRINRRVEVVFQGLIHS